MTSIVAIYGGPSSKSFAMCPVISPLAEERQYFQFRYEILGLAGKQAYHLTESELEHLINTKSALGANALLPAGIGKPSTVWIGDEFQSEAHRLNAPDLPDQSRWYLSEEGRYTIVDAPIAYKMLEEWVLRAAVSALTKLDAKIADLMFWTLPSHDATLAARYFTRDTPDAQDNELRWEIICGESRSKDELIAKHEAIRKQILGN